jgi:hypothetical protein
LSVSIIRYASDNNISKGTKLKFSTRIAAYSTVLVLLLALLTYTFVSHSVVDASILRTPGQFYQENPDGTISNLYNFKVANKKNKTMNIKFLLDHQAGSIKIIGHEQIAIPAGEEHQGQLFIIMPQQVKMEKNQKLKIKLYDHDKEIETISTTFMAPVN